MAAADESVILRVPRGRLRTAPLPHLSGTSLRVRRGFEGGLPTLFAVGLLALAAIQLLVLR